MFGYKELDARINGNSSTIFKLVDEIKEVQADNAALRRKINKLVEYLELDPVYRTRCFTGNKVLTRYKKVSKWKKKLCNKWGLCDKT